MRSLLIAATLMLFAAGAAQAKVSITVDKDAQMMTVAVDGVERYHWPVSTGNPSHETPNGSFRAFRMEEDHYSKEFDDAPMPHSIFFTKIGHAIHGTEFRRPPRHAGLAWLCAAVARQRHDAVRAGAGARRAQHHRHADRFVHGRAGPQSAATRGRALNARRSCHSAAYAARSNAQPQYSRFRQPIALTPQPQFFPGRRPVQQPQPRSVPTTATSIRPTAVQPTSVIRRRAQPPRL